jgi:MoaA/NifB/PqqE/SkfB family radical SAM enzyme
LVISGGEPLAYRSEGKSLLDAAEKHPDILFMFYTNGTLIDEKTAQRMAALGNVTPAISGEGWRDRIDERRGSGVFDQILAAMEQLRKAGVFLGISLTATRHKAEEILSEEFIDYFFEQQGAFYGWIFQYMPIGRSYTLDLMPTPEQRLWMWKRSWEIVKKHKIFLADFWNHGTLSNGCFAGGHARGGGYLYIDWNGHDSPCVFVPYSPVNVRDIYAQGGTLNDVWANPFFADIHGWQESYWQSKGNWLAPCLNRDHHAALSQLIARHEPEPIDESARTALLDSEYGKGLEHYGELYENLSESIWHEQYLQDQRQKEFYVKGS